MYKEHRTRTNLLLVASDSEIGSTACQSVQSPQPHSILLHSAFESIRVSSVRRSSCHERAVVCSGVTLCATVRTCVRVPPVVSKNMQKYEKLEKIGEGERRLRLKLREINVVRRRSIVVWRRAATRRFPVCVMSPLHLCYTLSVNTQRKTVYH